MTVQPCLCLSVKPDKPFEPSAFANSAFILNFLYSYPTYALVTVKSTELLLPVAIPPPIFKIPYLPFVFASGFILIQPSNSAPGKIP